MITNKVRLDSLLLLAVFLFVNFLLFGHKPVSQFNLIVNWIQSSELEYYYFGRHSNVSCTISTNSNENVHR